MCLGLGTEAPENYRNRAHRGCDARDGSDHSGGVSNERTNRPG